jgi:hypothetical protein
MRAGAASSRGHPRRWSQGRCGGARPLTRRVPRHRGLAASLTTQGAGGSCR